MTEPNTEADSGDHDATAIVGDDQRRVEITYGHGRMPLFLKFGWLAFLTFATWYVVTFLLEAIGEDLAG